MRENSRKISKFSSLDSRSAEHKSRENFALQLPSDLSSLHSHTDPRLKADKYRGNLLTLNRRFSDSMKRFRKELRKLTRHPFSYRNKTPIASGLSMQRERLTNFA